MKARPLLPRIADATDLAGYFLLLVLLAVGSIGVVREEQRREKNACAFVTSLRAPPTIEDATAEELAALRAIGPRLALRIVSFRAIAGGLDHRSIALIPGLAREALEEIRHSLRMRAPCPR